MMARHICPRPADFYVVATPIVPADPLEVVFMASSETAPPTAGSIKGIVAASLIGTTVEWYDFFLYGSAAALVFNELFFPVASPWSALSSPSSPTRSASPPAPWAAWSSGTTGTGSAARSSSSSACSSWAAPPSPWVCCHPREHRRRSPRPPHPPAPDPGVRARRGVGRGGATRLRARGRPQPRLLGLVAPGRGARRQSAGHRGTRPARRRPVRRGLPRLGLADPVPAVRRAGGDRPVDPGVGPRSPRSSWRRRPGPPNGLPPGSGPSRPSPRCSGRTGAES